MEKTILVFLAAFVSATATLLFISATNGFLPYEGRDSFKRCSVGQNTAQRNTTGTAIFNVTFKDGNVVKIDCAHVVTK